ncbi:hypothetical protein [Clavibacter michiganensis]|uniref:hypothetical protein n=1 Tax=Clavibacter michiganensis TaxID=28447 RepID=UPI0026DD7790|nr:hypothetical protein [Clavibacter michiganensis]MDO4045067.1 hypothetical protein [Clavibacter michiganensis]MDO4052156.1 hypothetical protein [Clavibacter michiganensis]MDO4057503.1 hypothetical protein [Clavibacter michiganensis]MDO4069355.1 hypothetical protein [Clavibacter michiganensis]
MVHVRSVSEGPTPGEGGFGIEGSWQRIDLPAAMAAKVVVTADGTVSLVGTGKR